MNCGLSEKHLMTIREILAQHQAITHAFLFGSRARETFKAASDVDIALKGDIDIRLIAKIKAEFEESNLPFFVDIVDYAKADNALKSEIDAQGILLYVKDISHFSNTHAISKDCALTSKYDKSSPCHSELEHSESEKSDRDISLVSQAQYDTIALTQNQVAFSKYPAFIYMVSNKNNTTLYIGVTSNLQKRIYEHKNHLAKGFSDKYNCEKLVYFESFDNINQAIEREKYLKGKKRAFKENLINAINPKWLDLYDYLFCHSKTPFCHSEPALAAEESQKDSTLKDISLVSQAQYDKMTPTCHIEPLGEVSHESNRDISLTLNMTTKAE